MRTSDFNYVLPEELIAQEPLEDRAGSRLLVLDRSTGAVRHDLFKNIGGYFSSGDVLVVNDTRVSAFRLRGKRPSGAAVEALFLERQAGNVYRALMKPGRRLRSGDKVLFGEGLIGRVIERVEDGSRLIELSGDGEGSEEVIRRLAETPLPPYIKKPLTAGERYQTVYSARGGSSAAPTAGLHFTGQILEEIRAQKVKVAVVTLHIGASTFRPVRTEDLDSHKLAAESFSISPEAAETINSAGGRVIAVGTTSTRALEASVNSDGKLSARDGQTDLFIRPGHKFQVVQGLLTNFHMPRSTLFILVSAFAGRERLLKAYEEAKERRYRFLSLGDAMLIL